MFLRASFLGIVLLLSANQARAEIETASIPELSAKPSDFDKKLIRITFHYRDKIKAIDRQRFCVRLFDKDANSIWVEFTYAGLSTIKDIPTLEKYDASKTRQLFGQAWAVTNDERPYYFIRYTTTCPIILDAFGTTSEIATSGIPQFQW